MEVPAMLRRSVDEFGARVSQIRDDQWEAGTPDTEWNVRDLVNHVLAENLWAPPLLAGSTISDVGDRFDGDVLGPDPKRSWLTACGDALAAADAPVPWTAPSICPSAISPAGSTPCSCSRIT